MTARARSGSPTFSGDVVLRSVPPAIAPSFYSATAVAVYAVTPPGSVPAWDRAYVVSVKRRTPVTSTLDAEAEVLHHRPYETKGH